MAANEFTPKQQRFVEEYVIDLNGAQAAIRAGYKERSARAIACELLTKPDIQQAIKERQANIAERLGITAAYVLQGLRNNAERAAQVQAVTDREGNPTGEYRYDGATVNRALELLGKHLGMLADKTEHSGPGGKPIEHKVAYELQPATVAAAAQLLRELESNDDAAGQG